MGDGCLSCKKWEKHWYWNNMPVEKTHFIKVMAGDFSRRLSVPKKFARLFRGDIGETVELKGPGGKKWRVGVAKTPDNMFFMAGWNEFAKDHSLTESDLLVFKYDGNSSFNVFLFDSSCCEKESSHFVKNASVPAEDDGVHMVSDSEDDTKEEEETPPPVTPRPNLKRKDPSPSQAPASSRPRRSRPTNSLGRGTHMDQAETHDMKSNPLTRITVSNKRALTGEESEKAKQMVRSIQPRNPFFITLLKPSHVKFCLILPHEFVEQYIPIGTPYIIIRTPQKKHKWSVTAAFRKNASVLNGNWLAFVLDNNLKAGDICLFELISTSKEVVMMVHVSRVV